MMTEKAKKAVYVKAEAEFITFSAKDTISCSENIDENQGVWDYVG